MNDIEKESSSPELVYSTEDFTVAAQEDGVSAAYEAKSRLS